MRTTLLATAAFVGLTASASTAFAQSFSGFYVGGHAGYNIQPGDGSETILFDNNLDGTFGDTVNTSGGVNAFSPGFCGGRAAATTPAGGCSDESNGAELGARVGYDWQFDRFVVGALAEVTWNNINDTVSAFSTTPARYTMERELNWTAAFRVRGGYVVRDDIMAYLTGGYVRGDIDHSFSTSNTVNTFTQRGDGSASGYQLGGGVEYNLTPEWRVGVEYLYTALDDDGYRVRAGGPAPATNAFILVNANGTDFRRSDSRFDYNTIRVTMTYRFSL
jgi:opacity protein-like surface antigen